MDSYRRQPPDSRPSDHPEATTDAAVDNPVRLLRRLLPFPSSADASSLQIPLMPPTRNLTPQTTVPGAIPPAAGQHAASIVSEAASILDEEMARGVLAARDVRQPATHRDTDRSTLLRQVHEVIDNLAEIWPTLEAASAGGPGNSESNADLLPELKPPSAVRPGQRATITMMLCNRESRPVRLVPVATDLLNSDGGRIASRLLEFVPGEVRLEAGEQRELRIVTTVPSEASAGCYAGLLVVCGVAYLRALITIEVV